MNEGATEEQYIWFADVAQRAYDCVFCPRMERNSAVLGPLNGRVESQIFVIGEAPGRFGSAVTGIPFTGDRSGKNFDRLLKYSGLQRADLFIVNAVQCNPKDSEGRNDRPTSSELQNCSGYLRELLDIVHPPYVVTLGVRALDALHLIEPHSIKVKDAVATVIPWRGTKVVPLYHPSSRALASRSFEQQAKDYEYLALILRADPEFKFEGEGSSSSFGL